MILLKKIRLINWYGFTNATAPIGFFTLIAGKNGNGKSVMLDAIKYAAYSDTVFNKSSESKGSRTLSSYTRGLLDATAGTYMRPADKIPNVYTHIALEFYDDTDEKPFVLGCIIETNSANNCQTYRYVIDKASLDVVEHTYHEGDSVMPYSASAFQKKYQLQLFNKEQALPRFMQMTGLRLNLKQIPTYLRKLRGIMSYDPDAKIDRFIRESVLEERTVDFTKLIEAKENIERLNETFSGIENNIKALDEILEKYDAYENESNRLLLDDIKIVYKKKKDLQSEIEELNLKQKSSEDRCSELEKELMVLDREANDISERLIQANISMRNMDSTRAIEEERRRRGVLIDAQRDLKLKKEELENFQTKIGEMMSVLFDDGVNIENKAVLASLCSNEYTADKKRRSVDAFKVLLEAAYDETVVLLTKLKADIASVEDSLSEQENILEQCSRHSINYSQIPEYLALKEEISREFAKRNIKSEVKCAFEYVIKIKDEAWRNAIEAFLGRKRYTILVDPKYYNIADKVLNNSKYRYAHLFNTALLMKKEVVTEDDSVVNFLEIKNPVAQKYFDYQLGRMHATGLSRVKEFENAISKEGRVSVAMDGYFLRFDKIRYYYLGQETFELNRKRAEAKIAEIRSDRSKLIEQRGEAGRRKNEFNNYRAYFREYTYTAVQDYQENLRLCHESEALLQKLEDAQKINSEFVELNRLIESLEGRQKAVTDSLKSRRAEQEKLSVSIELCIERVGEKSAELNNAKEKYKDYELNAYSQLKKAVETYEKYLQNGRTGLGGLLAEKSRERIGQYMKQYKEELMTMQAAYISTHAGVSLQMGVVGRDSYASYRNRIWMDDLQEIRNKLDEQTKKYEDIFKNEFVLTILKACEKARDELKQINRELARLDFSAKYEFDIHYVHDGSDYVKILEYARYLDEREKLGGSPSDGQLILSELTQIDDDEGEQLEKELKAIISRIIATNSKDIIEKYADYRNYMTYEILITDERRNLAKAKLSRQTGFNSGAEVQIPYILILSAALLMIYNQRVNSTRLVFIDEPFAKMDPGNVKVMLDFMRQQNLQVIFCSPDKTESIGNECEVILPVLRVRPDIMQVGIVRFHEENKHG